VSPSDDCWYLNAHARCIHDQAQLDAMAAHHDSYDEAADGGLPADVAVVSAAGLVETWRHGRRRPRRPTRWPPYSARRSRWQAGCRLSGRALG
jgi:hypothetical protein